MKERKRRGVILFGKRHFGKRVRRGSSELAVTIVIEHSLEICASARNAIEISIAFAKREVSVRPARTSRIIVEIFLIFRNRQIVKLASKQRICVLELATVGRFGFPRRQLGKEVFYLIVRCSGGWFLRGHSAGDRRLIYRPGTPHFRLPLSRGDACRRKQHRQPQQTGWAAPDFHFAVAKATLVTPASV